MSSKPPINRRRFVKTLATIPLGLQIGNVLAQQVPSKAAYFWCCTGSALEDYAKLNDTIYFHDADGVYVNLFTPSQLNWKKGGIKLHQQTLFPEEATTRITIEAAPAERWTLRLRIPAWTTEDSFVVLNGRRLDVAGSPGSYLSLSRVWKHGDRVELTVPMRLRAEPLPDDRTQQAFVYGPIVLAGQFPKGDLSPDLMHKNQGPEIWAAPDLDVPGLTASGTSPEDWIKPLPGQSLAFVTAGQNPKILLKPLNQSWERFAVYWTVA